MYQSWYLARYGMTVDQFRSMTEQQGGVCAICRRRAKTPRLHVDHCHTTGAVRGLLCEKCNVALGLFDDDPERMREAATYLEKSR